MHPFWLNILITATDVTNVLEPRYPNSSLQAISGNSCFCLPGTYHFTGERCNSCNYSFLVSVWPATSGSCCPSRPGMRHSGQVQLAVVPFGGCSRRCPNILQWNEKRRSLWGVCWVLQESKQGAVVIQTWFQCILKLESLGHVLWRGRCKKTLACQKREIGNGIHQLVALWAELTTVWLVIQSLYGFSASNALEAHYAWSVGIKSYCFLPSPLHLLLLT